MSVPLLQANGLRKSYASIKVLKAVSLAVGEKETLAVIGPNGAGKTTLFKVLTGEVPTDEGTVRFKGDDVTRLPAHRRAQMGFGRTFQVARVFPDMTALENVVVAVESVEAAPERGFARLAWWPSARTIGAARQLLDDLGLDRKRDETARNLSHGDKKRLELACCLALRPRILMLDEPTAGMSPSDRAAAVELIARVRQRHGVAVMLTEHDMGVVFGLADRVVVLNYGEVIAVGTGDVVRADPRVRDIYLGSGAGHA